MNGKLLSVQVYEQIKQDIISLKYLPGSLIKERELAKSMDVSRTPVREALQRLAQEHWIVSGECRGMQISTISMKDVNEIKQIRNIVELSAVEWSVRNGTSRILAGYLDSALSKMREIQDQYSFTKQDIYFHSVIVSEMHNERLLRFWRTIQEELTRTGLMALKNEGRYKQVLTEHEQLVDALWNREYDKVHTSMEEHLENSYASMMERLEIPPQEDGIVAIQHNQQSLDTL